ncbi:hypothetical protein [Burkholderia guangdongensis]|uniref:hypothetical protein n=1 Tax=Burkholderia guangdongensis TaxID=1792500 RepID=UPI0015C7D654|nr:hypothetical protein [Burkholderia guangdongensis]
MEKILHSSATNKLLEFAGSQKNIDLVAKWLGGGVAVIAAILAVAVTGHLIIR